MSIITSIRIPFTDVLVLIMQIVFALFTIASVFMVGAFFVVMLFSALAAMV